MTRDERSMAAWHFAWGFVYAANLVVPLFFGWHVAGGDGVFGMGATAAVGWLTTQVAVAHSRRFRAIMLPGAVCTAVSQVVPLLHMFAGVVSLSVVERIRGTGGAAGSLTVPEAVAVTALTGLQLLLAAAALGVFCYPLTWALWEDGPKTRPGV